MTEQLAECGHPLYWKSLYRKDYDLNTPESVAHPAKASWDLGFKILEHLKELGLLKPGDTVLDPLSGIGRFNLCAAAKGFKTVSVELEPKFVEFERQNLEYAQKRLFKKLDWTILQGDARQLSQLLTEKGLITMTSPPWVVQSGGMQGTGFDNSALLKRHYGGIQKGYGQTEGQIGNLPDRPLKSIMSPPYAETGIGDWKTGRAAFQEWVLAELKEKGYVEWQGKRYNEAEWRAMNHGRIDGRTTKGVHKHPTDGYSDNPANIGNLPDRPLRTVTSPPYENGTAQVGWQYTGNKGGKFTTLLSKESYGETDGQIEQEKGISYLSEMQKVYAEIRKVSDCLTVIVKCPTRNGKLRNLTLDTFLLLKMCCNMLYCNCETNEIEKGIELDDNEWKIYKTLAQNGKSMLSVRVSHKQLCEDRQVLQAQSEGNTSSQTQRGNKSKDTGQESITNNNAGTLPTRERSIKETLCQDTQESETDLRYLREGNNARLSSLQDTRNDARSETENSAKDSYRNATISRRRKAPFPINGLSQNRTEQSDVAGRDTGEREQESQTQQSELAESSDALSSEGQFHLPDVREGRISGSAQERTVGRGDNGIQPRRIDNTMPRLPYEERRTTQVCGICGKEKVESQYRQQWYINCTHRALLFEELEQADLFGGSQKKVKGRMSFFRRLAWQKGQPCAQWEDVITAIRK